MPVDFGKFLNIKPDVERAIADLESDIEAARKALVVAQETYDFVTTQATRLRTVLTYLNELTPVV